MIYLLENREFFVILGLNIALGTNSPAQEEKASLGRSFFIRGSFDHNLCFNIGKHEFVPIQKLANLFEIKARGKFNRRHMVDIPRIKFFAQRRYRANWPFLDGH